MSEEIVRLNREYTLFSWSAQGQIAPIPIVRAEGVYFWDASGKRYLDFASQVMNVNIGHGHPQVIRAIQEQAAQLAYAAPSMATRVRGELGRLLAGIAPAGLKKSFFTLGGAEANENAIKMARLVTGRSKIVTRYRSYHGATYGALSAGGDPRRLAVEPGIPGIVRVLDPYCYRCPFGQDPKYCRRECVEHVEQVIQFEGPENVAAVLMEGVSGTNGILVPPVDYWPRLREICDRYGILLISDEVMSGFGRTGEWFAVNHWGVAPDMITMAKGLTSGYLPLGAVLVSERIAGHFEDHVLWAGLTGSGHPLCCAAAAAVLRVYQEEGLLEHCRRMETQLAEGLLALQLRHPALGQMRGIGLFWVLELVQDRQSRRPLAPWNAPPSELGLMRQLIHYLREHGLYAAFRWNWLFVVPPLCITADQIAEGLAVLDGALEIADGAYSGAWPVSVEG
ncbi:MAG: aminotransferase class III-fold pyridoxal phosphate-dependent enzyme [Chloroflexia bacterium]|nr:aminotransferase class III-fold pyridoxal phosphate-dependent enzyme [Chloroflexia bacterium]